MKVFYILLAILLSSLIFGEESKKCCNSCCEPAYIYCDTVKISEGSRYCKTLYSTDKKEKLISCTTVIFPGTSFN